MSQLRDDYERPLWLLLAIAGAVLLIACANLANLLLARASVREREMAVRIAIGAGRGRLIRQLFAESALLTLAGTLLGTLLAQSLSRYLVGFLSTTGSQLYLDLGIDWLMLAFTASVAIVTCLLFGIAPALRAASTSPGTAMKSGGRAVTADRSRFGLRRVLVVVQVALSLVLLSGALLFGRSLYNLTTLDTGLNEQGLVTARVATPNYPVERRAALFASLRTRLQATPGVADVATAAIVPLSGSGWNPPIEMIGVPRPEKKSMSWFNRVSPSYFRTVGTPLLAGRDFNDGDNLSSPEVAIVTQKFGEKWLNGGDPVGKQFRILSGPGEEQHVYRIVGVVKDSKYLSLARDIEPLVYVAAAQERKPGPGSNLILRSGQALGPLSAAVKTSILAEYPDATIQFRDFQVQIRDSLLRERLMATLSGFFGLLAALLASVGLYGVISYMVAKRKNEIGIRVALGATQGNIVQLVIREATVLVGIGLVVGVLLTAVGAQEASSLVYGLKAQDPSTMAMAVALLAMVSLLASGLPALRASRLDPVKALREE